jgi:hypothetical protein
MREKAGPDLARAGREGKLLGLALGVEVCVAVPLGLEVVEGDGDREVSDAEGDPEAGAGTCAPCRGMHQTTCTVMTSDCGIGLQNLSS